jgi:hypothetical protein
MQEVRMRKILASGGKACALLFRQPRRRCHPSPPPRSPTFAPLTSGAFRLQLTAFPADVEIHSLPAEAERLAPQLRGFAYIVVEEQIALVDRRTRKVEPVFPRWAK